MILAITIAVLAGLAAVCAVAVMRTMETDVWRSLRKIETAYEFGMDNHNADRKIFIDMLSSIDSRTAGMGDVLEGIVQINQRLDALNERLSELPSARRTPVPPWVSMYTCDMVTNVQRDTGTTPPEDDEEDAP